MTLKIIMNFRYFYNKYHLQSRIKNLPKRPTSIKIGAKLRMAPNMN